MNFCPYCGTSYVGYVIHQCREEAFTNRVVMPVLYTIDNKLKQLVALASGEVRLDHRQPEDRAYPNVDWPDND